MNSKNLHNKVAIVTGGGSGIGASIAKEFDLHGAHVHILEKVIPDTNDDSITYHACDVTNLEQVKKAIARIHDSENSIDILVNNAGIAHIGDIEHTEEEDMDRVYAVNIKGVYHCAKACIGYMKKQEEGGVILNMASIASHVGIFNRFAYSMSKGAVLTMTYSIAKDFLKDNIRCNSISPARVHTPFVDGFIKENYPEQENEMFHKLSKTQPIGRMGKPEEIAKLALYLCSDGASFITGTDFPIDGGFIKLNGQ